MGDGDGMAGEARDRYVTFPNQYIPPPSLHTKFTALNKPFIFLFPHL